MTMHTAEFLFPRDLESTATNIRKVLFVGSCLSEAYLKYGRLANPNIDYEHILFNNAVTLPAKTNEELSGYQLQYIQLPVRSILTDAVIRISDNDKREAPIEWLELGKRNLDLMLDKALAYNAQSGILSIVSTFFVPQGNVTPSLSDARTGNDLRWVINELNNYLAGAVRRYANAYLADIDMIANSIGKMFFLDDFIFFYTHGSVHYPDWQEWGRVEPVTPFAEIYENRHLEFFEAAFRQMEVIYRTAMLIDQVKVVIFDLDNTLWRGQIAEDYRPGAQWPHPAGWPMGLWEAVHHLNWRGIVTAIASKNDEEVVVSGWSDAVNPPFVKFEDFLVRLVNWKTKAENIDSILQSLSLTPKSAVFIDDHPIERESVRAALPGIRVIGSNPFLSRRILLWSAETQTAARTEESKKRSEMLSKQIQREQERASVSHEAFLASLDCKVEVVEISDHQHKSFSRVLELVNKTNQFNTTSKRWALPDYISFWGDGGRVFGFSVSDKFTDYGLVGVVFANDFEIVQYVMSCRVLGLGVENAVLGTVIGSLRNAGSSGAVFGSIFKTKLNGPCLEVFRNSGFDECKDEPGRFMLPGGIIPSAPSHVTVKQI